MAEPTSRAPRRAAAPAATLPGAPAPGAPAAAVPGAPASPGPAGDDAADLSQGERESAVIAGDAPRVGSLAEAAAALSARPLGLPSGGPGVGAAHFAERAEGIAIRPVGTLGDELRRRVEADRPAQRVTRDVLPRRDFSVDPATVPGHRYATAAAQLRRHDLTYQPGETVRIDYRAYLELVPIAGILDEPWSRLPDAPEPDAPEPPLAKV